MKLLIRGGRLLNGERADIAIDDGLITRIETGVITRKDERTITRIDDREITEVGAGGAGGPADDQTEVIDAGGLVVMPGLVDAHRHVWQAPLRGVAPDMTLPDYIGAVLGRALPRFRPEDV